MVAPNLRLLRRIHRAFDTRQNGEREAQLLGLLREWDTSGPLDPRTGTTNTFATTLTYAEYFLTQASAATNDTDRQRAQADAIGWIAAAQARMAAQVTEAELGRHRFDGDYPREQLSMAARAAELCALAYAAADDPAHGLALLDHAVTLEAQGASNASPEYHYNRLNGSSVRHSKGLEREEKERVQRATKAQAWRLVALAYPPGFPLPVSLGVVAGFPAAVDSPQAQLLVSRFLLDRVEQFGAVVSQMQIANLPPVLQRRNPNISQADARVQGAQVLGYIGLAAVVEVLQAPDSGVGALKQALEVLEGEAPSFDRPNGRVGAYQSVDKATASTMLLQCAATARARGGDEAAFIRCRTARLLADLFPTAESTRVLHANPVVDAPMAGTTLRHQLGVALNGFLNDVQANATALGVTSADVANLRSAIATLPPDAQLELGAHAAIAALYTEISARPVEMSAGAARMGRPWPNPQVAVGTALVQAAKRTSQGLAMEGRALGLPDSAVKTLQTVARGMYTQAEQAYQIAGDTVNARDAQAQADSLTHVWGL